MQQFIQATRDAVTQGNWYAALALALTMPDICGRLEDPSQESEARFVSWYDRFLLHKYQFRIGPHSVLHSLLSGADCYALRCAFLNQGEFGAETPRAREALRGFHFVLPRPGSPVHLDQTGDVLQLHVDRFCLDVCEGVEQWLASVAGKDSVQERLSAFGTFS